MHLGYSLGRHSRLWEFWAAALSAVKILMPFLSSISWSGMPTGGFCQGIRSGISMDRAGIAAGVADSGPRLDSNAGYGGACRFEVDVAGEAL